MTKVFVYFRKKVTKSGHFFTGAIKFAAHGHLCIAFRDGVMAHLSSIYSAIAHAS